MDIARATVRVGGQRSSRRGFAGWRTAWEKGAFPFALFMGVLVAIFMGLQGAFALRAGTVEDQSSLLGATFWLSGSILITALVTGLGLRQYKSRRGRTSWRRQGDEPHYDSVTGLPTGRALRLTVNEALGRADRGTTLVGLLLLDLQQISLVNATQGSASGDSALRVLAARIKGCVQGTDSVARLVGDRFGVLLPYASSAEDARMTAQKILQAVVLPMSLQGEDILINSSIGIALAPIDGTTAEELLDRGVEAMEAAQSEGLPIRFASDELNARLFDAPV